MAISVNATPYAGSLSVNSAAPTGSVSVNANRPTGGVTVASGYGLQGFGGVPNNPNLTITPQGTSQQILNSLTPSGYPTQIPGYTPPAPVYAPKLDLSGLYSKAGQTAANNVNPYYTKQLNDFITQQAAEKANEQKQTEMNIQNIQDQQANTLQANAITGQRTSQDVLQNEQQAGIKADQQQQDQGTQFDQARIDQAKKLAAGGLTTSGAGAQQVLNSETEHNTQEARQAADVAQQNQAQELFKTRTFEDLARSGDLAKSTATKGTQQANFDLEKYIQGQATDLTNQKNSLEQQRLARLSSETQSQAKLAVNQFIQSISNPAQRLAAAQQYGGLF